VSDEQLAFALEVLDRSASRIDKASLEDDLYQALEEDLPPQAHRAIVDVLALLSQARDVASGKGTKREKGEEVLHLLNLTNAKSRHVEYRDRMVCRVIAGEMRSKNSHSLTSVLRDGMANLIATDPSEIGKIWKAGRELALAEVARPMSDKTRDKMVQDEKLALAELSRRLGNRRGN
jgi:hypothetical protein